MLWAVYIFRVRLNRFCLKKTNLVFADIHANLIMIQKESWTVSVWLSVERDSDYLRTFSATKQRTFTFPARRREIVALLSCGVCSTLRTSDICNWNPCREDTLKIFWFQLWIADCHLQYRLWNCVTSVKKTSKLFLHRHLSNTPY